MPYRSEVLGYRRVRGTRDLERVERVARWRTEEDAKIAARNQAEALRASYDTGSDYYTAVGYRVRKDTDKPIRTPPKRRAPAVRGKGGRWHDRKGRIIKGGKREARRRNRISRKLLKKAAGARAAKRAARRTGKWGESSQATGSADESPPSLGKDLEYVE